MILRNLSSGEDDDRVFDHPVALVSRIICGLKPVQKSPERHVIFVDVVAAFVHRLSGNVSRRTGYRLVANV